MTIHAIDTSRTARRSRRAVRLAVPAEARARRRARSAHAHHRAARRARRPRCGRAGRRSRLGEAARRQGAACSTARRRRCRSTRSSRSTPRCRTCCGSTRRAMPRSCMRARRPIASARISTGRTCWKAGCPIRAAPTTGWLNRALGGLEPEARVRRDGRAFAVGPVTPLVVRGPTPVMSWTPARIQPASEDTMARLIDLYHHTDTELARAIEGRMDLVTLARASDPSAMAPTEGQQLPQGFAAQVRAYFADAAGTAAKFLARADGPRIGALAFNGWDTHIDEGADSGRLATLLGALDGALAAVEKNMGDGLARDRGRGGHRIRPHRAHQRHQRHRSRHRHDRAACGRRAQGWPRDRRLAGPEEREPLRGPRPRGDYGSACRAEGPAQGPSARHRSGARRNRVPGQRRREADGRAGRVTRRALGRQQSIVDSQVDLRRFAPSLHLGLFRQVRPKADNYSAAKPACRAGKGKPRCSDA